jgi:hypothetical protein
MAAQMVVPQCPGCGREAPRLDTEKGRKALGSWILDLDRATGAICPDCASSPGRLQEIRDEWARAEVWAQGSISEDTIVFPFGRAKTLGECTDEELRWVMGEHKRRLDQIEAWSVYIERMGAEKRYEQLSADERDPDHKEGED